MSFQNSPTSGVRPFILRLILNLLRETDMNLPDSNKLGSILKQARQARGLTQEEVTASLGMARTTLVAIEHGDRTVSAPELIQFADFYGRSLSEWINQTKVSEPLVPQFRAHAKQVSVAEAEVHKAVADLESIVRDYIRLEEITERPLVANYPKEYSLKIPGISPDQRGEEVASSERARLGLGDSPVSDLRSLLEDTIGLRVFFLPLQSRIGGLYAFNDALGGCIAINLRHPPSRANWSLAHEYGHFLTTRYSADVSFWDDSPWGKNQAERFADSFAKNFLMPRSGINSHLTRIVESHGKGVTVADVVTLTNMYRVSAEAMFRRLEELKRLPRGTWDRLRDQGFKPDTAHSNLGHADLGRESMLPARYKMLAWIAYHELEELTEGQLVEILRSDRVSARMMMEEISRTEFRTDEGFQSIEADLDEVLIPA